MLKHTYTRETLDQAAVVEAVVEFGLRVGDGRRVRMALLRAQVVVGLGVVVLLFRLDRDEEVCGLRYEAVRRDERVRVGL